MCFEQVGLEAPAVDTSFHSDTTSCNGHLGCEVDGPHGCVRHARQRSGSARPTARDGHRWIYDNVSESVRDRFLEQRGLRAWNELDVPWDLHGYERGETTHGSPHR